MRFIVVKYGSCKQYKVIKMLLVTEHKKEK